MYKMINKKFVMLIDDRHVDGLVLKLLRLWISVVE